MCRKIRLEAGGDPHHIHVITNILGVGNIEVNAFQMLSDIVVQKSIQEGFGLVVSETLWKGTPMVAGQAGSPDVSFRHHRSGREHAGSPAVCIL